MRRLGRHHHRCDGRQPLLGLVLPSREAVCDTKTNNRPDVYAVQTTCPLLWDVLGFPGSFEYEGPWIYFNRTDVQKAVNAPVGDWAECSGGVLEKDTSPPSGLSVLPDVIEKNKKTVIAHGQLDFILLTNGTIMMVCDSLIVSDILRLHMLDPC